MEGKWTKNLPKRALKKVMEKGVREDGEKIEIGGADYPKVGGSKPRGRDKGRGKPLPWNEGIGGMLERRKKATSIPPVAQRTGGINLCIFT